ncbi:MAG: hypothetical protein LBN06_04640 [Prevotellaceae bacterium]|jgi:hypothetical protein|nr:hypothetical protein [Prevotellaceae bacterium]
MKQLFSTILLLLVASVGTLSADNPVRKSAIGVSGGYDVSYGTFIGEAYYQRDIRLFRKEAAYRIGVTTHAYQLDVNNVTDLDANSVGLFGDLILYPFNNGLSVGIRWEGVNINWLSSASKQKLLSQTSRSIGVFSGTSLFLQAGYDLKLSDRFEINIYGQPGFQEYSVSNGNTIGNYSDSSDGLIESKVRFVFNLNIGLVFRL